MKHLILFLLLFCQFTFAQEVKQLSSMPLQADSFVGVDSYKFTYFIKDRVLHKTGQDGDFVFNDLQLGQISSVDIINPLKVLIFFQDTNTVVLLDNKLSEIERISFNYLTNFINVASATNAENNSLWIFNVDSQQLELYNYRTKLHTVVSQPFPGKLLSQASNFNYCFMLTENKLRAFNIYGSLLKETEANDFEKVIQYNENLIALKENNLYYIPYFAGRNKERSSETFKLELPEITIKDLQLTKDFLYIYDGKSLHTFSLTIPKQ